MPLIPSLNPHTDPEQLPVEEPLEYDPDAWRWVEERSAPHAEAGDLYEQAEQEPGFTIIEVDPYQPHTAHYEPAELIATTTPDTVAAGHPGVDHLDTAYTNYTPAQERVGQVAVNLTAAAVAAALTDNTTYSRYTQRVGPGILIGYILTMNGAQTGKFAAIVDSVNDDGPVLALINSSINTGGMVSLGHDGIQFNKGLTIIQHAGDPIVIIPVIAREVPVKLGER